MFLSSASIFNWYLHWYPQLWSCSHEWSRPFFDAVSKSTDSVMKIHIETLCTKSWCCLHFFSWCSWRRRCSQCENKPAVSVNKFTDDVKKSCSRHQRENPFMQVSTRRFHRHCAITDLWAKGYLLPEKEDGLFALVRASCCLDEKATKKCRHSELVLSWGFDHWSWSLNITCESKELDNTCVGTHICHMCMRHWLTQGKKPFDSCRVSEWVSGPPRFVRASPLRGLTGETRLRWGNCPTLHPRLLRTSSSCGLSPPTGCQMNSVQ